MPQSIPKINHRGRREGNRIFLSEYENQKYHLFSVFGPLGDGGHSNRLEIV